MTGPVHLDRHFQSLRFEGPAAALASARALASQFDCEQGSSLLMEKTEPADTITARATLATSVLWHGHIDHSSLVRP